MSNATDSAHSNLLQDKLKKVLSFWRLGATFSPDVLTRLETLISIAESTQPVSLLDSTGTMPDAASHSHPAAQSFLSDGAPTNSPGDLYTFSSTVLTFPLLSTLDAITSLAARSLCLDSMTSHPTVNLV